MATPTIPVVAPRSATRITIKDNTEELRFDCGAVKELGQQYMRAQIKREGTPGPQAIDIDESSIRKVILIASP